MTAKKTTTAMPDPEDCQIVRCGENGKPYVCQQTAAVTADDGQGFEAPVCVECQEWLATLKSLGVKP
jgi:hypothetical protein